MLGVCKSCTNELVENSIMKCGGFCSALFCVDCAELDPSARANVDTYTSLYWMCKECCKLMENARFKNALVSSNAVNTGFLNAMKDEIRSTVLEEIKHEIRSNFEELIKKVPKTPVPPPQLSQSRPRPSLSVRNKRLRENDDGDDDVGPRRPVKALCAIGTGITDMNIVASKTSDHDPEKFWLYLSGIVPDVPDEKVVELVQARLGTTDLHVVKLVARGRNTSSLTFVSYKVGMSPNLKAVALATETWPRGIRFREFENVGSKKQVFWRPELTPTVPSELSETPKTAITNLQ